MVERFKLRPELRHADILSSHDAVILQQEIARYVESSTTVRNEKTGYIICRSANKRVDTGLVRAAAKISRARFAIHLPEELFPEIVIGVPSSGVNFAFAMAEELEIDVATTSQSPSKSRRGSQPASAHHDDENDALVIQNVRSFTKKGEEWDHTIKGLDRKTKNVLVVDDFSATGEATIQYLQALTELGYSPVFIYLIAKDFQNIPNPQVGFRNHLLNGVKAFAVVRVTEMKNGKVTATADDIIL